jgi:hypothetical protein
MTLVRRLAAVWIGVALSALACGSSSSDAGDASSSDGGPVGALDASARADAAGDAGQGVDGGQESDGGGAEPSYPADRFATSEMYMDGACGGYGESHLPGVVLGPPVGGGADQGSLDVVSLGTGGSIVLGFSDVIVDGPGTDFLVFENPFLTSGQPDFELAQVSVSDDGVTWTSFPCTATGVSTTGYGTCAGWHPVYSSPTDGISPLDPAVAGGDPFDLATIGVTSARFVRVVDVGVDYTQETCLAGSTAKTNGFDLDAVSIVNAALPDGGVAP